MELGRLIDGLDVRLADSRHASVRVCDITEDSRTVLPGSLYIARRGDAADGNDFIPQAIAAGAVAVLSDRPSVVLPTDPRHAPAAFLSSPQLPVATAHLAERFYGNPSSKLLVFGVTGTNGKTTTSSLIHQLLNASHLRTGLIGTVFIDDGTEVAPASMTTPPALEISRTLARMLEAGCRAAVLETSSHALDQGRVAAMRFDVGLFTNLTGDHLDYHKTMDAYADAKARLFAMLPESGAGIVNADDPAAGRLSAACRAPVHRVSLGAAAGADLVARVRRASRWGTDATFTGPWGEAELSLPFVGRHNLMNALEALAGVWAIAQRGSDKLKLDASALSMEALGASLRHATLPPGRLQCLTAPTDPITVYVDYAHTDDALRTVLEVFREVLPRGGQGRLVVVFGCGGDRDTTKRPRMGAVAAELADRVFVTSDNPRTEDPRSIIDAIVSGMPAEARARTTIEPDREQAILAAVAEATDGDVVIIAGKGHEDYQILPAPAAPGQARGTVKRFFDDRLIARDALAARGIRVRDPDVVVRALPSTAPHGKPSHSTARTERT